MMYTHSNNETVKRINVSKIANTNTQGDNSTAAGCDSRLITVLYERLSFVRHNFAEDGALKNWRRTKIGWASP